MIDWASPSVSIAVVMALTPIGIYVWGRAFPVKDSKEFFEADYETLKRRNGWIDGIATLFMFTGLALSFFIFFHQLANKGIWVVGLCFGSTVIFHFLWVCIATLPFGTSRFREFWRFYELRWRIGITGIKAVYVPIGALGFISAVMIRF